MQGTFNPMQIIRAISQGQSPQEMVMQIIQERMGNTPLGQNLMNLARNNDTAGIEQVARNMAKQKGIDYDKEFQAFKNKLGM